MNWFRQFSVFTLLLSYATLQAVDVPPPRQKYVFSTKRGAMTMREISRNDKTSRFRVSVPTTFAVGDATGFLMEVCYKNAVARGATHFVYLWGSDNMTGPQEVIVGFTNESKPNIKKEFGAAYSSTDRDGDPHHVFSVRDAGELLRFVGRIKDDRQKSK